MSTHNKLEIESLCEFIPYLEKATKESVVRWEGGDKIGENSYSLASPIYHESVRGFIDAVYKSGLMHPNYGELVL